MCYLFSGAIMIFVAILWPAFLSKRTRCQWGRSVLSQTITDAHRLPHQPYTSLIGTTWHGMALPLMPTRMWARRKFYCPVCAIGPP